ncbi:MAG: class I SAM-dependent methyltransferase [Candidatus Omnitrophica bacterium]|nr:class I SAM-dependent methyltransferase [Candidatus Omnitrophota bacterium]
MQPHLYEELFKQEQTHWWHVGKRERILGLLRRFCGPSGGSWKALDAGCGTGGFLQLLSQRGEAVGMDHEPQALEFCRRRGVGNLIQHELAQYPWPVQDKSFDLVTALDVVEHVEDDAGFAREMHRILKPGGVAVVSVPSFQWMWSYWDEWLGHKRRYIRGELMELMEKAGFEVVWSSYAECATLLAIAPLRWMKQRRVKQGREVASDNAPPHPIVNQTLLGYERIENQWLRWGRLPWGTSVVAVGVKPSGGE